eukprot:888878-Pyramimonas_sp.AAC.2
MPESSLPVQRRAVHLDPEVEVATPCLSDVLLNSVVIAGLCWLLQEDSSDDDGYDHSAGSITSCLLVSLSSHRGASPVPAACPSRVDCHAGSRDVSMIYSTELT